MSRRPTFAAILLVCLTAAGAMAAAINEYQMKAVYVYNLAKFVEWPPGTFKNPTEPITICVLGASAIGTSLEEAINGEKIDDRKLTVRVLSDVREATSCHILFVAPTDRKRLRSMLRDLPPSGVLTVGESDGFLAEGGAVNFSLEGNRVRIDVNLSALGQQKLRISPKLLNLARNVMK